MKKLVILTLTLALSVSVFVCRQAFAESVAPWNVRFDVEYGGDTFRYDLSENVCGLESQAEQRLFWHGVKQKRKLYRELVQMGLPTDAIYDYILPGFGKVADHFAYVCRNKIDAVVQFGKNGFTYRKSQDGVEINVKKLFETALSSCGKTLRISLPITTYKACTAEELKQYTLCRGTFSTSYASGSANRCHNVERAAAAVNGVTVGVGETFSFNATVGERTEANGYKTSKVIMDGNYADGVGGGVCQVSTTLYNALLLAGFVPKAVQHSLVSSYVKPGFDAMVSYGTADLTFVNDTDHPVYIAAETRRKQLTFTVYGEANPFRIVRESVETRDKFAVNYIVDKNKYPELVYTDQTKVVVGGSDGVKTKSYLNYYLGDKLVDRKLIRTNSYKRVDAVIARGYTERGDALPEN